MKVEKWDYNAIDYYWEKNTSNYRLKTTKRGVNRVKQELKEKTQTRRLEHCVNSDITYVTFKSEINT